MLEGRAEDFVDLAERLDVVGQPCVERPFAFGRSG
jgi:hypothetical protein